jgi:hypothetical protein
MYQFKAWSALSKVTQQQKREAIQWIQATLFRKSSLLGRTFYSWEHWYKKLHHARQLCEDKLRSKNIHLKQLIFVSWSNHVRMTLQKFSKAYENHQQRWKRISMRRVFISWVVALKRILEQKLIHKKAMKEERQRVMATKFLYVFDGIILIRLKRFAWFRWLATITLREVDCSHIDENLMVNTQVVEPQPSLHIVHGDRHYRAGQSVIQSDLRSINKADEEPSVNVLSDPTEFTLSTQQKLHSNPDFSTIDSELLIQRNNEEFLSNTFMYGNKPRPQHHPITLAPQDIDRSNKQRLRAVPPMKSSHQQYQQSRQSNALPDTHTLQKLRLKTYFHQWLRRYQSCYHMRSVVSKPFHILLSHIMKRYFKIWYDHFKYGHDIKSPSVSFNLSSSSITNPTKSPSRSTLHTSSSSSSKEESLLQTLSRIHSQHHDDSSSHRISSLSSSAMYREHNQYMGKIITDTMKSTPRIRQNNEPKKKSLLRKASSFLERITLDLDEQIRQQLLTEHYHDGYNNILLRAKILQRKSFLKKILYAWKDIVINSMLMMKRFRLAKSLDEKYILARIFDIWMLRTPRTEQRRLLWLQKPYENCYPIDTIVRARELIELTSKSDPILLRQYLYESVLKAYL